MNQCLLLRLVIVSLLVIYCVLPGCSTKSGHVTTNHETAVVDSLIIQNSSFSENRATEVKNSISQLQKSIADSINFYKLEHLNAKYLYSENDLDSAIIVSKRIIDYCNRVNPNSVVKEVKMMAMNDLSVYWQTKGQRDLAIECLTGAERMAVELGQRERLIDIYINLADNQKQNSDFIASASSYRKAMLLADSLNLHS